MIREAPRDLGAVDGDEGELRGDEDSCGDHQQHRDGEQQPGGQHRTTPELLEEQGEGRLSEPSMGGSGSLSETVSEDVCRETLQTGARRFRRARPHQ